MRPFPGDGEAVAGLSPAMSPGFGARLRETVARHGAGLLSGDLSPRQRALTIALGVTLGVFPLPWGASILCIMAAWVLRLNQIYLQAVNYLAYPLQLVLFIPFYRLGKRWLAGWHPRLPDTGALRLLARLGPAAVKALAAWLMVAPFLFVLVYLVVMLCFSVKSNRSFRTRE